jgi:hypothetical protein
MPTRLKEAGISLKGLKIGETSANLLELDWKRFSANRSVNREARLSEFAENPSLKDHAIRSDHAEIGQESGLTNIMNQSTSVSTDAPPKMTSIAVPAISPLATISDSQSKADRARWVEALTELYRSQSNALIDEDGVNDEQTFPREVHFEFIDGEKTDDSPGMMEILAGEWSGNTWGDKQAGQFTMFVTRDGSVQWRLTYSGNKMSVNGGGYLSTRRKEPNGRLTLWLRSGPEGKETPFLANCDVWASINGKSVIYRLNAQCPGTTANFYLTKLTTGPTLK